MPFAGYRGRSLAAEGDLCCARAKIGHPTVLNKSKYPARAQQDAKKLVKEELETLN
jgi:hypothetical protein